MKRIRPSENTPRVLAVAVAFFGGMTALGLTNGVFEHFNRAEIVGLALFAALFAGLVVTLDSDVRGLIRRALSRGKPAGKVAGTRPAIT